MSQIDIPRSIRCCVVVNRLDDRASIQIKREDDIVDITALVARMMDNALPFPSLHCSNIGSNASTGIIS